MHPPLLPLTSALIAVWLIWGSTYLAMAYVVDAIPPFLGAGMRHLLAGVVLLGGLLLMGKTLPSRRDWGHAAVIGTLMLVLGNGIVFYALGHGMPSGLATLLLAITPAWVVLGNWWLGGSRPGILAACGIIAGITGVALLCQPQAVHAPWWTYALVLGASWSWAMGVVLGPKLTSSSELMPRIGAQMCMGGIVLLGISAVIGEPLAAGTSTSWIALGYLVAFGSLIAFTAYTWLQHHANPGLATSNNYVNPLVAVALGTWLRDEPLTGHLVAAAIVIVLAVVLVVLDQRRSRVAASQSRPSGRTQE